MSDLAQRSRAVVQNHGCSSVTYHNPWSTFQDPTVGRVLHWKLFGEKRQAIFPSKEDAEKLLPSVPIDKELLFRYTTKVPASPADPSTSTDLRVPLTCTWCGHSAFVVQQGGITILTDPVWAERCSPLSFLGPKRMVPIPIALTELPPIDVVTISHNHYDHLDTDAVQVLCEAFDPIFVVPLGMKKNSLKKLLGCKGVDPSRFVELNWWEEVMLVRETGNPTPGKRNRLVVSGALYEVPTVTEESEREAEETLRSAARVAAGRGADARESEGASEDLVAVRVASVPVQHWSMRSGFDRHAELWCGFVARITTLPANPTATSPPITSRIFHCGDTGYCPAFKEIGQVFGGVDLGLIPIGAYNLRNVMRPQHVDPHEAVLIHQEIGSKYSIGMHWGTFILTDEAIDEPPKKLREEMEKLSKELAAGTVGPFVVQKHGESTVIPVKK